MNVTEAVALAVERLRAYPVIVEHEIQVLSEAEAHDLEAVISQELAKGSLHIVVAAGSASYEAGARAGVKGTRTLVVTLAYLPGMAPPPVVVLGLSSRLAGWLHGWPATGSALAVTEEAPIPDGADVAGRQIILSIPEVLLAER